MTKSFYSAGAAAVIVAYGCATTVVDPALDSRAERFQPSAVYARWWAMTESCSGLNGSLANVKWYQVPGSDVVELNSQDVGGYWAPVSNSIVLAGNGVLEGGFVRHEMLHALVRAHTGHSRSYFLEKCAGVVSCAVDCVHDAGTFPPPDASVAQVSSDILEISTAFIPALPSQSVDDGFFTLVVSAKNPKPFPVVIVLSPPGWNRLFSYNIGELGFTEIAIDPEFSYFKAGETKQHYFDFKLGPATAEPHTLTEGLYTLIAGYDDKKITIDHLQIGGSILKQ